MNKNRWQGIAMLLVPALLGSSGTAFGQFEATPYVGYKILYDDNVFRYRNRAEAVSQTGDSRLSDTVHDTIVGGALSYKFGKQDLFVNGSAYKSRYEHFEALDYDGNTVSGGLNWALGRSATGSIRFDRSRDLRDFGEFSGATQRSIQTSTTGSADIAYRILSEYQLRGGVSKQRTRNSLAQSRDGDIEEDSVGAGLSYLGIGKWVLSFDARLVNGEFTNQAMAPEYEQQIYLLGANWTPSPVSSFYSTIGLSSREEELFGGEKTEDVVGSLGYTRRLSPKTSISTGLERSVSSTGTQGENSAVISSGNASVTWLPRSQLSFTASLYARHEDYQDSVISASGREDGAVEVRLESQYGIGRYLVLLPNLTWGERQSNQDVQEFDYFQASLEVRLQFGLSTSSSGGVSGISGQTGGR